MNENSLLLNSGKITGMRSFSYNKVFAAACLGMLLFGIAFLSLGTVSTFIQTKFSLSQAQAASLASSLPFGMLAGTLIFGPIADRFGYKLLLIFSSVLIMLALELTAFADKLTVFQISFFAIGMGGGVINGATNALAADITEEKKGARLSLLGVFFGLGALGMPLLTGILTRHFSYDIIIAWIGWSIFIPVIYFLITRFPEPKQKQGFPIKQGLSMLRDPILILIGMVLFFESGLEGMVSNWTTTYLVNGNIHADKALFSLSIQVAALMAARLVLAGLLRNFSSLRLFAFCIGLVIAGSLLLFFRINFTMVLLGMGLLGFGFAAGFPVMLGITGERYPTLSGTAFSIVIIMALIGNTLLNYLTGIISNTWGIKFFPLLITVCALVMLGVLRWIKSKSEPH
jgi:FHS family glucose/mannose:H+ symporter-like MFS transporter